MWRLLAFYMRAIFAATVLAAMAGGIGVQMANASSTTPLKVVLTAYKYRIKRDEQVLLNARLVNVGDGPLSIFGDLLWSYGGGFAIHISDDGAPSAAPRTR